MSPNPILLILGSGPRVGTSVAKAFASKGYTIVLASRSGTNGLTTEGYYSLRADLSNPASIPSLFATVKKEAGGPPSVVVCNAGSFTSPPDKDSVLSIPAKNLVRDFNVNTISPYVAAYEAAKAWDAMGGEDKKTFIYTGNILNTVVLPIPMLTDAGMGKAATAYWIGVADANFAAKGYRFHYAEERTEEGKLAGMAIDGPAHGEFYAELAEQKERFPWHATFVKGKGYTKF